VDRYRGPDFPLYVAGEPVLADQIQRSMQRDMLRFVALSVIAIAIFLWILFRRLSGVILPLLVVGISLGVAVLVASFMIGSAPSAAAALLIGVSAAILIASLPILRSLRSKWSGHRFSFANNP